MLKHDSPLGGASCGSVNVSSNNSLKFKNNIKKNTSTKQIAWLMFAQASFIWSKKNSIEPKSAVMADVVWPTTSATQRRIV
jgi:hypothetical protein